MAIGDQGLGQAKYLSCSSGAFGLKQTMLVARPGFGDLYIESEFLHLLS